MLLQNQISSPGNHVEADGLSEISKSTSKINPSKSDPSSFGTPTQMNNISNFHQILSHPWQIVTLENIDGVAEYNIYKITPSTS